MSQYPLYSPNLPQRGSKEWSSLLIAPERIAELANIENETNKKCSIICNHCGKRVELKVDVLFDVGQKETKSKNEYL